MIVEKPTKKKAFRPLQNCCKGRKAIIDRIAVPPLFAAEHFEKMRVQPYLYA